MEALVNNVGAKTLKTSTLYCKSTASLFYVHINFNPDKISMARDCCKTHTFKLDQPLGSLSKDAAVPPDANTGRSVSFGQTARRNLYPVPTHGQVSSRARPANILSHLCGAQVAYNLIIPCARPERCVTLQFPPGLRSRILIFAPLRTTAGA
jgi:hypothetical protein